MFIQQLPGLHPVPEPSASKVTPSPLILTISLLSRFSIILFGGNRGRSPQWEGQIWRPKLEPSGPTPDTHLPPPESWLTPAHRGGGGQRRGSGTKGSLPCGSVSPWSHQCARDSGGVYPHTRRGLVFKQATPSQGSAWQSWPKKVSPGGGPQPRLPPPESRALGEM